MPKNWCLPNTGALTVLAEQLVKAMYQEATSRVFKCIIVEDNKGILPPFNPEKCCTLHSTESSCITLSFLSAITICSEFNVDMKSGSVRFNKLAGWSCSNDYLTLTYLGGGPLWPPPVVFLTVRLYHSKFRTLLS